MSTGTVSIATKVAARATTARSEAARDSDSRRRYSSCTSRRASALSSSSTSRAAFASLSACRCGGSCATRPCVPILEALEDVLLSALHRPVVVRSEERPQDGSELPHSGLVHDRAPVELADRGSALVVQPPLAGSLEVTDQTRVDSRRPLGGGRLERETKAVRKEASGDDPRPVAGSRRAAVA